jgi:hypothetical protein
MAWKDSDEIVVAKNGEVFFAPVGTALPTTPTAALNSAFVGAGFTTEDGVALTVSPEIMEVKAWQSRQPVRRDLNAQDIQAVFQLQQFNEENIALALGGGEVSEPSEGIFRYDFLEEGDSLDERALVIDAVDGSEHHRFVFPRGNVTEAVEIQFQRGSEAKLPITFKVLEPSTGGAPGYYLTDSAAFESGS